MAQTSTAKTKRSVAKKGKRGRQPQSKSEIIRKLHVQGKDTGEIRHHLEKQGFQVHYSEIYGAIERAVSTS